MANLKKIATLIVKTPIGGQVMDKPLATTYGGKLKRNEARGARLDAYVITKVNTVPWAMIDPVESFWVRIAEADGKTVHCEVIEEPEETPVSTDRLADVLERLVSVLERLVAKQSS